MPSCNGTPHRHILRSDMIRRVSALVFALMVASAPAALTACELTCAAADTGGEAPTHSCHSQASGAPISVSIVSGVHVCGHGDALPAAPGKMTAHGAPSPAIAVTSPLFLFDAAGIQNRSRRVTAFPPGPPNGTVQLRI